MKLQSEKKIFLINSSTKLSEWSKNYLSKSLLSRHKKEKTSKFLQDFSELKMKRRNLKQWLKNSNKLRKVYLSNVTWWSQQTQSLLLYLKTSEIEKFLTTYQSNLNYQRPFRSWTWKTSTCIQNIVKKRIRTSHLNQNNLYFSTQESKDSTNLRISSFMETHQMMISQSRMSCQLKNKMMNFPYQSSICNLQKRVQFRDKLKKVIIWSTVSSQLLNKKQYHLHWL